jgi:hypothetical protein
MATYLSGHFDFTQSLDMVQMRKTYSSSFSVPPNKKFIWNKAHFPSNHVLVWEVGIQDNEN